MGRHPKYFFYNQYRAGAGAAPFPTESACAIENENGASAPSEMLTRCPENLRHPSGWFCGTWPVHCGIDHRCVRAAFRPKPRLGRFRIPGFRRRACAGRALDNSNPPKYIFSRTGPAETSAGPSAPVSRPRLGRFGSAGRGTSGDGQGALRSRRGRARARRGRFDWAAQSKNIGHKTRPPSLKSGPKLGRPPSSTFFARVGAAPAR